MKTPLLIIFFAVIAFTSMAQQSRGSRSTKSKDSLEIKTNDARLRQKVVRLSLGFEYGLPVGQAYDIYGTAVGGLLKVEIPVAKSDFYITATVGVTAFLTHLDYSGTLTNIKNSTYLPAALGGKYYFSRLFYVEGDAGVSYAIDSYYAGKSVAFYYAPIIGISAPTSKHKANIDIGLSYDARVESGNTIGEIAVRLAYKFGFN